MKISHDGLVYKLAWKWQPWCKVMPIRQTDICTLVRAMTLTFVKWLFAVPALFIICIVLFTIGSVIAFLFGHRLSLKDPNILFVPLGFLKKYKPLYLLAAYWICQSIYGVYQMEIYEPRPKHGETVYMTDLQSIETITVFFFFAGVISLIFVFVIPLLSSKYKCPSGFKSEFRELTSVTKEYFKAKKQKVCPMVEIE